jgi:hypothetical protein
MALYCINDALNILDILKIYNNRLLSIKDLILAELAMFPPQKFVHPPHSSNNCSKLKSITLNWSQLPRSMKTGKIIRSYIAISNMYLRRGI